MKMSSLIRRIKHRLPPHIQREIVRHKVFQIAEARRPKYLFDFVNRIYRIFKHDLPIQIVDDDERFTVTKTHDDFAEKLFKAFGIPFECVYIATKRRKEEFSYFLANFEINRVFLRMYFGGHLYELYYGLTLSNQLSEIEHPLWIALGKNPKLRVNLAGTVVV